MERPHDEGLVSEQIPLNITPSPEAVEIDRAHKIYRDAIGTPREELARVYLELIVAKVKAAPRWRLS